MMKLRIVPPYGLNDRLENKYKKNDTHLLAFNKLPPLSKKHTTISDMIIKYDDKTPFESLFIRSS